MESRHIVEIVKICVDWIWRYGSLQVGGGGIVRDPQVHQEVNIYFSFTPIHNITLVNGMDISFFHFVLLIGFN